MHPVLFEIFGLPISPYGLLIACGLIVSVTIARHRARRVGIPEDSVLDVVFWGVIAGFIGARIAFIIVSWDHFIADPLGTIFSRQGFVFLGGLFVAIPVVLLVLRRWRVRFWPMADLLAPCLALAHAFGRTGCFFAGCCYGRETSMPWGIRFPRLIDWGDAPIDLTSVEITDGVLHSHGEIVGHVTGSIPYIDQVLDAGCPVNWMSTHSMPIHPTQLYDVAIQITLFVLLTWLWRRRRFHGQVFIHYFWLYGVTRIGLEFFRGDPGRGVWTDHLISTSQVLSTLMIAVAAALWLQRRCLFAPANSSMMLGQAPEAEGDP
jgi:phosphatidylglycerol---prolipoprotein diacylglyceryl transferase